MKLYHGTNAADPLNVVDNPTIKRAVNGAGFYLTPNLDVARKYGRNVIYFDLSTEVANSIKFVVRPINQAYVEGIVDYSTCALQGMEYVINNQNDLNTLALDAEDAGIL